VQQPHNDKELRINVPQPFNGDRKKYKVFQNAIVLYLTINRHIYDDNEKKIGFVLSYLNDKEAAQWHEAWIEKETRGGCIWFPTFQTFLTELNTAFQPVDAVRDAMHKLRTLKQGTKSAEELVTEFNLFCSQAGITQSGDITLINLFQPALNKPLLEKILDGDTYQPPLTIGRQRRFKLITITAERWPFLAKHARTADRIRTIWDDNFSAHTINRTRNK
jgi:hypothetical protein